MRKSLLLALVSLGISFGPGLLAAGKPDSCGADVKNVVVQFFPTTSEGTPSNIVSDAGGIYANTIGKGNKITVLFQNNNCSYDFTMNLFQSSRVIQVSLPGMPTTAWFFNFDRIGSVPVLDGSPAHHAWCNATVIARNTDGSFDPNPYDTTKPLDNYGGCDSDGGGVYAKRSVGFSLVNDYGLRFRASPFEVNTPLAAGTSYIKVYHPSANEWTLEPEAPATSVLLQQANSGPSQFVSNQPMPFKMVITRVLP